MARIVAIQELVKVMRQDLLGNPRDASARLARIARAKLAEVETKQGKYPTVVKVDGRDGASEDSVRPDGMIVYLIHPFTDFTKELLAALVAASPKGPAKAGPGYRSMHFAESWRILVNDQPVPAGTIPEAKPGDVWTFVNPLPYARRLAWGWSVQAPPLWIDVVAKTFQQKYGNLFGGATIKGRNLKGFEYTFIIPPLEIMPPEDHNFSEKARMYNRHLRYPAILVRVPGNALTT